MARNIHRLNPIDLLFPKAMIFHSHRTAISESGNLNLCVVIDLLADLSTDQALLEAIIVFITAEF